MTDKKRPHESDDRDAENAASADSALPMERFKNLARKITNVSRDQLRKEQERYAARRSPRKKD